MLSISTKCWANIMRYTFLWKGIYDPPFWMRPNVHLDQLDASQDLQNVYTDKMKTTASPIL